jgi:putative tributyrin esterase
VLPPLVLAMPSDGMWGLGSGYVRHATQDFERWIVDDVPAAVRQACGACSSASPLFIAGLSMGGFGALRLVGRHPQRFAGAAGLSSITDVAQFDALGIDDRAGWAAEPQDRNVLASLTAAAKLPPLHLSGRDDALLEANRLLHTALLRHGIAHTYAEHDGAHSWDYWSQHLEDTLRFFALQLEGVHR